MRWPVSGPPYTYLVELRVCTVDTASLVANDTHTHAEDSCLGTRSATTVRSTTTRPTSFGSSRRPTIDETLAYYREKKIGFVMFTVASESQLGRRRVPNEEIAEAAQKNADIMIAFGSRWTHTKARWAREARKLIEEHGVNGFKFNPPCRASCRPIAWRWPIYEVINEHKVPAVFHSGHSGIGSGMRCGGGLRLQNSNPMLLKDVAMAFPDMQIIESICRAGGRSTFRRSWCNTRTRCRRIASCSAATSR